MPELPSTFEDAIRDRYLVDREIGEGGMATVYLARDVRHKRAVAIKVLKPELAASVAADRFLKEIEIAARLTHPHIVPLYDSGRADGLFYFVMPFIEEESLRVRIGREAPMEAPAALEIVTRVGDALSYAHRQGVLHRDIKPENILFAAGHPMIADFGIARALHTAGGDRFTRTGMALGTPGYMSPEQLLGEREIDARSDIYGLACLLYEMLIGAPPGMWQTDERALATGRFVDVPEPHRVPLARMPRRVERALVRALTLRPQERFDTVDAFLTALRDDGIPVRRYSDQEVEKIVRQAADAELAAPPAATGAGDGGMSLRTVQSIAAEVGISPQWVERAAARLERAEMTDVGSGVFWLGSPTTIWCERVVDGELAESAHEDLVDEIEATLSTTGRLQRVGAAITWETEKPTLGKRRAVQVRVTSRGGTTRIRIQERLGELAVSLFPSISVGGGIAGLSILLSLGGPEFGFAPAGALGALWVGGMHAIARTIFRAVARGKREDLEGLGRRLADIAGQPDREPGAGKSLQPGDRHDG